MTAQRLEFRYDSNGGEIQESEKDQQIEDYHVAVDYYQDAAGCEASLMPEYFLFPRPSIAALMRSS